MRIKKYIAKSMREALLQIKDELGEEAIILKTRKLPKKMFALGSQDEIEVTAAVDDGTASTGPRETFQPLKVNTPGVYSRPRSNVIDADLLKNGYDIRPWKPPVLDSNYNRIEPQKSKAEKSIEKPKEASNIVEIKENLRELKDLLKKSIDNGANVPPPSGGEFTNGRAVLYKKLIDSEIKHETAEKLIKNLGGAGQLSESFSEKKLLSLLTNSFLVAGPLKLKKKDPLIVAFVGPTGSGKTTTLAKLAAHCSLNKQKKVSIITADTYRIAAIEQIRMFADIVKIGLQVVFSPEEIPSALENCSNDDIVFVDTAGRSQRNAEHMGELKSLIDVLNPDEVHLVLSAATKNSDLTDIIGRYRPMNVNRLLFTKLDETVKLGNVFNVVDECGLPVSYFTFGQSVPDDIELAQPIRFVERLWEGKAL